MGHRKGRKGVLQVIKIRVEVENIIGRWVYK